MHDVRDVHGVQVAHTLDIEPRVQNRIKVTIKDFKSQSSACRSTARSSNKVEGPTMRGLLEAVEERAQVVRTRTQATPVWK